MTSHSTSVQLAELRPDSPHRAMFGVAEEEMGIKVGYKHADVFTFNSEEKIAYADAGA